MPLLLTLAWRNIWRNRRRTLLTVAAIAFATFFTVLMRGMGEGTWEFNVRNSVEMFSGYLQIQREGYGDAPSLRKSIAVTPGLEDALRRDPRVTGFAPRILADGLVSLRAGSVGASVLGVDPDAERSVSRLPQRVVQGRLFTAGSRDEVVLGAKLLHNLQASVGDTIVILSQAYDGVLANQRFRVVGAMKLGVPEFDATTLMMSLTAARELLAMEGRASVVAIAVGDLRHVRPVQRSVAAALDGGRRDGLAVLRWDEVTPELKQAMDFDKIGDWFFLGILVVIVTFGILNTLLMSVTERFREFGVTLSVGMPHGKLAVLVLLETLFLTLLGVALGGMAGYGVNLYFAAHPIMLGGEFAQFYEEYGFVPQIVATSSPAVPLIVAGVMFCLAFLAALYPVYRVGRLEPLKGIRYT